MTGCATPPKATVIETMLLSLLVAGCLTIFCQGHPEIHPLNFLRHDRAAVKLGKSLDAPVDMNLAACMHAL